MNNKIELMLSKLLNKKKEICPLESSINKAEIKCKVSSAQRDLWETINSYDTKSTFNLFFPLSLEGKLNIAALEKSFLEIIRRHQPLRTKFSRINNEIIQIVSPPPKDFNLPIEFLPNLTWKEIIDIITAFGNQKLSLNEGPLFKVKILGVGQDKFVLLILIHHIIFDGGSRRLLFEELSILYNSIVKNIPLKLPDLLTSYSTFIARQEEWLHSEDAKLQFNFWQNRLNNIPELNLTFMKKEISNKRSFDGKLINYKLEGELFYKLKKFSNQHNITLFNVILTNIFILLSKYSTRDEFAIGVPVAGRNYIEEENIIGLLSNTIVISSKINPNESFLSNLNQIHEDYLEGMSNQNYPFEKLCETLSNVNSNRSPFFQVMLIYEYTEKERLNLERIEIEEIITNYESSEFDLTFWIQDTSNELNISCVYNTLLFHEKSIIKLVEEGFFKMLHNLLQNPLISVSELFLKLPVVARFRR